MNFSLLVSQRIQVEALASTAASLEQMTGVYDQITQLVLNRKIMGV